MFAAAPPVLEDEGDWTVVFAAAPPVLEDKEGEAVAFEFPVYLPVYELCAHGLTTG